MERSKWVDRCISAMVVVFRWLAALRYRIEVRGLEKIRPEQLRASAGVLFLPNHPAEIDPVLLELILWPKFQMRPLVVEHFYYLKGFRFFLDVVGALPLPSMDRMVNKWVAKKLERQFEAIATALQKGGNFLIYPSGRLKTSGLELIGGASLVHQLVQRVPDVNIVLVRTTGLWGSQFSKAQTGVSPDFGKTFWRGIKILLKNGIFFAPRRKVLIELELNPKDLPVTGTRLEFNKYLENWYNRHPDPGSEPLILVSYAFWKEDLPSVAAPNERDKLQEERPVSPKIQEEICIHLSKMAGIAAEKIDRKMNLAQDLGLDSLDVAQLHIFVEQQYGASELIPGDLLSVEDVLQAAAGYKREREDDFVFTSQKKRSWPQEWNRLEPQMPEGKTLQEVFLKSMERNGSQIACADGLSSWMRYRRLKMAALLLSRVFKDLNGEKVGVMLPASVGAYIVILAILLAKKVPVMLNWTVGVRSLNHAVDLTGLEVVITSSKFLERLEEADLGKVEGRLLFLEDVKEGLGWKEKLSAFLSQWLSAKTLMRRLHLDTVKASDPAVILFTSGSESLPKGVPLSHENLLSNQRACLEVAKLQSTDIFYGVLPPFHSFGFSATGILPLLAGVKVCYAPDPTDSHAMAKDIAGWKPTLWCCAPSFIRGLFRVALPEELHSLRLIVSGAEKTPQDLFDFVRQHLPQAELLEGYGITECSPVVSIDRPGEPHRGVGKPLPNVALKIVDSATHQILREGEEGEVCIAGPGVFSGYLDNPRNPFLTLEGKEWYLSGDRGSIDPEGHLILSGRLKRFAKIGGEMISLGGVEEELFRLAREKQWLSGQEEGPCLALIAQEPEGDKPLLILFTTLNLSKEGVNAALRETGWGRIVKIAEIRRVEEIPLTGTGKTHYRLLDEMKI